LKKAHAFTVLSLLIMLSLTHHSAAAAAHVPPRAQSDSTAALQSTNAQPTATSDRHVTAYTLPPDLYRKAHLLNKIYFWGQIASVLYTVVVLLLILRWNWAARFRDLAERVSKSRIVQALIFVPPMLLSIAVLSIPFDITQEWVSRKFGLSIQSWASWLWDWTKGEIIGLIMGIILISILYAVIRSSPRRWWFYFWLASIPLLVLMVFLQPLIVDPLFHKFEPLQSKDPALTASLEQMVQRAGQDIPPERMFWMNAGEKTTALNAYVTGIGASKRIVVWNTTIQKMTTPQIVFVAGHEMGHYVLGHIWKGIIFASMFLFIVFFLGAKTIDGLLNREGARWGIRELGDWASFPALLLLFTVFVFLASPITSGGTRYQEHQADQYGLEVTHGLTPDSSQIAAQAFQVLGEVNLSDPDPNPVSVFLFYSHPTIPDRVHFALTYNPWASGGTGEFVK
jgi:STE24 endopeptidase